MLGIQIHFLILTFLFIYLVIILLQQLQPPMFFFMLSWYLSCCGLIIHRSKVHFSEIQYCYCPYYLWKTYRPKTGQRVTVSSFTLGITLYAHWPIGIFSNIPDRNGEKWEKESVWWMTRERETLIWNKLGSNHFI